MATPLESTHWEEGSPPTKRLCKETTTNDDISAKLQSKMESSESPMSVDLSLSSVPNNSDGVKAEDHIKAPNSVDEEKPCVNDNDSQKQPSKKQTLFETDVGITEFISSHHGFNGIIKQRYSDFLVNEINLDGDMISLTSLAPPVDVVDQDEKDEVPILSEEQKQQMEDLMKNKNDKEKVHIRVGHDKMERTRIHSFIRHNYIDLESSTGVIDRERCITVVYRHPQNKESRRRDPWPSSRGDYCHFVFYKENKDTMDGVNVIAKMLRMKSGSFTYAGTKDRRAKTCQMVSVYRVAAEVLLKLNDKLWGMTIGNLMYCKKPLRLGDLNGNHFKVVLRELFQDYWHILNTHITKWNPTCSWVVPTRNVTGSEEQVMAAMQSLKDTGFVNYFGMQRFGTTSIPTHHVGRALLQGKWSEAIDLILKPREGDAGDLAAARETWVLTHDAEAAICKLGRHRYSCIEYMLLEGILKHNKCDQVGALSSLPRNTRLMYVHAYQSFIWNHIVSRRIRESGLKVIPGDLVLKDVNKTTSEHKKPEVVTEETAGDYSIHDIVLPLPGWDVTYPQNASSQWYEDMLDKDGLTQESLKHKVKDYSLPGDYRFIVVRPTDVSWSMCNYDDACNPLILSDKDKMDGIELNSINEGSLKALLLEFSLPSSTYATMAIRDVLKADTSAGHQATLNID